MRRACREPRLGPVVDRARGLWRLEPSRLATVEVPGRIGDLVQSRIERLPQRALLEWLAVLDRDASPALLARLSARDEHEEIETKAFPID